MNEEKAHLLRSPFDSSRFQSMKSLNCGRVADLPFSAQDVVKKLLKKNEREQIVIRQDFGKANWHHMTLFCFSLLISGWMVFLSFTTKFTPVKDPEIVIFWTYNFAYGIWLIVKAILCRRSFILLTNKRFIMWNGAQDLSKILYSDISEVTYRVNCCGRDVYIRYDDEPRTLRLFTVDMAELVINQINFMRRQHWEEASVVGPNSNPGSNANFGSINSLLVHDEYEDYV